MSFCSKKYRKGVFVQKKDRKRVFVIKKLIKNNFFFFLNCSKMSFCSKKRCWKKLNS